MHRTSPEPLYLLLHMLSGTCFHMQGHTEFLHSIQDAWWRSVCSHKSAHSMLLSQPSTADEASHEPSRTHPARCIWGQRRRVTSCTSWAMRDLNALNKRRASRTSDIHSIYGRAGLVVRQYRSLNAAAKRTCPETLTHGSRQQEGKIAGSLWSTLQAQADALPGTIYRSGHMSIQSQHWRSLQCQE